MMYFFFKDISFSDSELNCLVVLSAHGKSNLAEFCDMITKKHVFKTAQTVRNFLSKAQEMNVVIKEGSSKKTIKLNPDIEIYTKGNILLKYNLLYASKEQ